MLKKIGALLALFERADRIRLLGLIALMTISAGLELGGIGLLLPLLKMIAGGMDERFAPLLDVLRHFGLVDRNRIVIAMLVCVTLLFTMRGAAQVLVQYVLTRTIYGYMAENCHRLQNFYLNQPWSFFLTRNSGHLLRNISQSVPQVFANGLMPLLSIVMELLVAGAIVVVLLVFQPLETLAVVVVLGIAMLAFHVLSKRMLARWSVAVHHHDGEIARTIQEGFGAVKEAKVVGRTGFFADRLGNEMRAKARLTALTQTFSVLPKMWIEMIGMMTLSAILVVEIWMGKPLESLVPTFGLFMVAAFRLMPSMNRILGHASTLRSIGASIDAVIGDLLAERANHDGGRDCASQAKLGPSPSILLADLCFAYGGADRNALDGISLHIPYGTTVALAGGSGAGKTTLADMLLGLHQPDGGTISIGGHRLQDVMAEWRRRVGYVPQEVFLSDDSVTRNIAFGLPDERIDRQRVAEVARLAQLDDLIAALPDGFDTVIGERGTRLSGGQRQRLGIARALYGGGDILVLDEATSALDAETESQVVNAIESLRRGRTIIVVAHRLSTIRRCDLLVFMKDGRVADTGSFDEVCARQPDFSRMVELSSL